MTLKVYGDLLSQPTRAVVLFCLANNVDHELVPVGLAKMEHKQSEYLAINPRGQIPAICDDGFKLAESATILRYLAASRSVADHWYPANLKAKASVDCLLDWYQTNLRQTATYISLKEFLVHLWKATPPHELEIKSVEGKMNAAMDLLEEVFLRPEEGPFLLGTSQPSIADVLLACEYAQIHLLTEADKEKLLRSKSKTKKWLEVVEKSLAPHFAEVHKTIPDLVKILEAARSGNK